MGPLQAIGTCFRKYLDFSGRAGRGEFWWFVLLWAACSTIAYALDFVLDLQTPLAPTQTVTIGAGLYEFGFGIQWLSTLVQAVFLMPLLAVGSRRLHDRDVSGWWQAILLLSCCLFIPQLVLTFAFWIQRGRPGTNRYGPAPTTTPPARQAGIPGASPGTGPDPRIY